MKRYLHHRLAGLCAILLASTISAAIAWSPTTPFMHVVTSGDKCFFVLRPADYEEGEGKFVVTKPAGGIAYQVQDDGSFKKLWSVEGWYALPGDVHLSPDGRTLIHVRDQQEFIGMDGKFPEGESQNVVTIYRDGKAIAGYTAKELITDMKKGIAWGWGGTWWVDRGTRTSPSIASSELHLVDIIEDGEKKGIYHPLVFQLKTIEGSCFEFDLESGKILARKEKEVDRQIQGDNDPFGTEPAEQDGAGQPATRPESKSEGGDKPQTKSEGRSR
jgi:hypothetical protein